MKRIVILIIIFASLTSLCLSQHRGRAVTQKIIQLTEPNVKGSVSFEEALAKQRDIRLFTGQTLERTVIGQLAWAAQGLREIQSSQQVVPSPEPTSPIQLYLATHEGVFIYQPDKNSLLQTIDMDIRGVLAAAAAPMGDSVAGAGCTFIVTAPTTRFSAQRGNNTRTSVYIQTGQIAQNIQLQAICLELGSVTISDFDKQGLRSACNLPRNLEPLYIICVGYPVSRTVSMIPNTNFLQTVGIKRLFQ